MSRLASQEVLARQGRTGRVASAGRECPAETTGLVAIRLDLDLTDYLDVNTHIWFWIDASTDGGVTWRPTGGARYDGGAHLGPDGELNPAPFTSVSSQRVRGKLIRGRLELQAATRIVGVVLEGR